MLVPLGRLSQWEVPATHCYWSDAVSFELGLAGKVESF